MARSTTKELTSGSPMKLILGFAVPLLFGMLFQQFYSLMDTIIVGRYLGVTALAAVGATGSINFLIIGFCQGICNGFGLPVAQRFGARDYDGVRKYVGNSAILSVLIGGVLTALTVIFCRQILVKRARFTSFTSFNNADTFRYYRPVLQLYCCYFCRHTSHHPL